ncbi:ADP-ribosylglycohydrolase family protein [Marinobacter sp. SS5-14b]|uniref:ADP-ribosylglycohydrolase family protein n=1 Tax=Marinobacter sp. SS5-14b TaxID=3050456 RepID=UPI0026E0D15C|nr:ADP-ribosylglycohydrolase family protein [Marinobacter sp. SS5-14b]
MTNINEFSKGALLGLAVGDALGTTVEFRRRDSFPLHTEMIGGGAFHVKPGEWTDDTAMALCLAQSLIEFGGFDSKDQLSRYVRWMNDGYMACQEKCIDIGNTTRNALRRFSRTVVSYAGTDNPFASGNGGIMRLAPAVIAAGDRETALEYAVNSSRTTHSSVDCLDAAELLGAILWELREGADLKVLLEELPDTGERAMNIGRIKHGFFKHYTRNQISSSGYVIDTLEAALWSCYHSECFEDALINAVNLGDDADTVGAVTGQIAGAAWGVGAIPKRWLKTLAWRERISELAVGVCGLSLSEQLE